MKKIIWNWNMVYYFLCRWEVVTQEVFNYPFLLLLRNKKIKKLYAKRGVKNPEQIVKNAVGNSKSGANSIPAGIHMGGLLVLLEYSIFNFIQALIGKSLVQYFFEDVLSLILFLALFITPAGIMNYYTLYKKDKYLQYFKEFDKTFKNNKRKYGWRSFLIIISFYSLIALSFII
ncbi:hypothetical protein EYV94_28630 [Puteibacter caeruleilacunae]|nr:hypothetical protein EYV94_28630 [Puteibacter caeruleilacunae]